MSYFIEQIMKCLLIPIIIWIGRSFHFVPRFFGLKVLAVGFMDITPDICAGDRPEGVESKVSWLVENWAGSPLPIKIIVQCVQKDDAWVQTYPVNRQLHGGWDRDFSCEVAIFDPEKKQKSKLSEVPVEGFLKIDCFAGFGTHPACLSKKALQIFSEDESVIIVQKDFLMLSRVKAWKEVFYFFLSSLVVLVAVLATIITVFYFFVQYVIPVYFFLTDFLGQFWASTLHNFP
jgi:hypothetical protein